MGFDRRLLVRMGLTSLLLGTCLLGWAQRISPARSARRALREMQIYQVTELGLEIWIEGQPEWGVHLQQLNGRHLLVAQSPESYHPPAALIFGAWDQSSVGEGQWEGVARSAIGQGGRNFGLSEGNVRAIQVEVCTHGLLSGWQGQFVGKVGPDRVDVRVFVGRAVGKPIVLLTAYTLEGKFDHIEEVIRRCWGSVTYLG